MKRKIEVADTGPLAEYFRHLDDLTGGAEPRCFPIRTLRPEAEVIVSVFQDIPEPKHSTAFTFGLSNLRKPKWVGGRPEVIVSVKSTDTSWALAVGEIVGRLRETALFEIGTVFNFEDRISGESEMTHFLLMPNSLLVPSEARLELSDRVINLVQMYPIFRDEAELIRKVGPEEFFFRRDIDFFDVRRKSIGRGDATS